jgi:hypothetical protein
MPEHHPLLSRYGDSEEVFILTCSCGGLTSATGGRLSLRRAWDTHLVLNNANRAESGDPDFDLALGREPQQHARSKRPDQGQSPAMSGHNTPAVELDPIQQENTDLAVEALRLAKRKGARRGKVRLAPGKQAVITVGLQAAVVSADGSIFGRSDFPKRSLAAHNDCHLDTIKRALNAMDGVLATDPEARLRSAIAIKLLWDWKVPIFLPASWRDSLATDQTLPWGNS